MPRCDVVSVMRATGAAAPAGPKRSGGAGRAGFFAATRSGAARGSRPEGGGEKSATSGLRTTTASIGTATSSGATAHRGVIEGRAETRTSAGCAAHVGVAWSGYGRQNNPRDREEWAAAERQRYSSRGKPIEGSRRWFVCACGALLWTIVEPVRGDDTQAWSHIQAGGRCAPAKRFACSAPGAMTSSPLA